MIRKISLTYLERALPHLRLELAERHHGHDSVDLADNRGQVLLTRREVRHVHLTDHVADA